MTQPFDFLKNRPFLKQTWVKYAAVAILPALALFYAPIVNYSVLLFGQKVLLETLPVDPTDFLRGDYVTLDYAIADIEPFITWEDDDDDDDYDKRRRGREVYVSLALDGDGIASVSAVSEERPSGLYLKGRAKRRFWGSRVDCDYGLGAYYIPEGTGRELEDAIDDKRVLADVRILRGRGVIKKLEVAER
ncbi:MAG: GDYXXLXY domain-containing protein [Synergistaceae bacterium]|jgi:uncharacterized membrane-anchored protein|nr:GDYXXLXY domain-containing protein [Synergistaceae bacterium]